MSKNITKSQKAQPLFTPSFITITFLSFLMTTCLQMTVSAMPLFIVDLGLSKSLAGSATTACTLAALVFRPFSARLSDSYGEKRTCLIGTGIYVIVFGSYFFCINIPVILLLRVLQGIGMSLITTSLGAIATGLLTSHQLTKGMSYFSLGNATALSIGPALGLTLVKNGNFNWLFLAGITFSLLTLALLFIIHYPGISGKKSGTMQDPKEIPVIQKDNFWTGAKKSGAVPPSVIMAMLILCQTSLNTYLSFYAADKGLDGASMFFTLNVIGMVISKPLLGKVCDRFGNRRVAVASCILLAIAFLLIAFSSSPVSFYIAGLFYGFGYGGYYTLLNVEAVRNSNENNRGIANSLFFGAKDVGTAVGSMTWGFICSLIGYCAMYISGAVIVLLSALFFLHFSGKQDRKKYPASASKYLNNRKEEKYAK